MASTIWKNLPRPGEASDYWLWILEV